MTTALLVVDVQNDYFTDGAMALVGMDAAADNCRRLLQSARSRAMPIYHLQHLASHEGATFFIPDTPGAEIHPQAAPAEDEPVIRKHFPSGFRDTDLDERLREDGVTSLVICGAMSHMCIDTTTRAAFDLGYSNTLIADACATRDLEFDGRQVAAADVHAAYMAGLGAVFARVIDTETWIAE